MSDYLLIPGAIIPINKVFSATRYGGVHIRITYTGTESCECISYKTEAEARAVLEQIFNHLARLRKDEISPKRPSCFSSFLNLARCCRPEIGPIRPSACYVASKDDKHWLVSIYPDHSEMSLEFKSYEDAVKAMRMIFG